MRKMQDEKTAEIVMKPCGELLRLPFHPFRQFVLSEFEFPYFGEISS
jgi:hypothetical protein